MRITENISISDEKLKELQQLTKKEVLKWLEDTNTFGGTTVKRKQENLKKAYGKINIRRNTKGTKKGDV